VTYTPTLYYGNIDTLAQTGGALGPANLTFTYGTQALQRVMNGSFGIQHSVGFSTVLDVSYVGSWGRHLRWSRQIGPLPMFARFDPANVDPTTGTPLADNFLRPYQGWGSLSMVEYANSSNYNSLQVSARRQFAKGLLFGAAYTWARALATTGTSVYFDSRSRYYGPSGPSQVLVGNFSYDLPKLGKRLSSKALSAVLDDWTLSGMTAFSTGSPFTPSLSTTTGADLTGSAEGARIDVISDPNLPKDQRTFYRNFKTEGFAMPTPCSATNHSIGCFGNVGVGILRGPGINNWDITFAKKIPVGLGEARFVRFEGQFYNIWNHTQFASIDSAARFDARTGKQTNANFGAFNADRGARIISFALRFEF